MSRGFSSRRNRSSPRTEHDKKLDRSVSRKRAASNSSMDVKDHARPSYYMKSLQYYYNLKTPDCEEAKRFKQHFLQSLASIKFLKKLRIPSMDNLIKSRMQLAKLENKLSESRSWCYIEPKTVIFDFEETLVHISKENTGADIILPVKKLGFKAGEAAQVIQVVYNNPSSEFISDHN